MLIVDDEGPARAVACALAAAMGLEVVEAADGAEAVDVFRQRRRDLILVIMDLTMPRMDGREAFRAMAAEDATIPVLLTSGYNETFAVGDFTGGDLAGFLPKPYNRAQFETAVRLALQAKT